MAQFSLAVTALEHTSSFAKAYAAGMNIPFLDQMQGVAIRGGDAHVRIYRRTGGRIGGRFFLFGGPDVVLLDHVGAKSGTLRTVPLICLKDGDDLVIVASKGGYPRHPAWFHNLNANPDTTAQLGGEVRDVTARVASEQERERLWPRLVDLYPSFGDYQRRTEREIPVFVLEPVSG